MKRLRKIVAIQGNPTSIFNNEGFKQEAENHRRLGLAFIMLKPGGDQATDRLSEAEGRLAIKLKYKGTPTASAGKTDETQKTDAQTVFGHVVYIFQELIDHYNDKLSKTMTAVSSKPIGRVKVSPIFEPMTERLEEGSLLESRGSSQPSSSAGVSTSAGVNAKGKNFWASEKGKAITKLLNVFFQCHGEAADAPPYIIDDAGKLSLKKGIYLDPKLKLGRGTEFDIAMRDFRSCDSRKTMRPAYEKLMLLHNSGYLGDVPPEEDKPAISQVRYRTTFFPKDLEYSKLEPNDIRTLRGIIGEKAMEPTRSATFSAVSAPSNLVASNTSFYEYLKAQGPVRIFEGVKTELRSILKEKGSIPYSNILFIREQLLAYRLELKRSLDQLPKEGVADLGVSRASTLKSDLEATLAEIEGVHAKMDGIIRCLWDINVGNVRPAVVEVPREPRRPTVRPEIREIMGVFEGEISNFSARTLRRDERRSSTGFGSSISEYGIAYVWQFLNTDFQAIADKIMGISGDLTPIEGLKMQQLLMQLKNLAALTQVEVEDDTYATVEAVRSEGEGPSVFQKPLSDAIRHCERLVQDLNVTARAEYIPVDGPGSGVRFGTHRRTAFDLPVVARVLNRDNDEWSNSVDDDGDTRLIFTLDNFDSSDMSGQNIEGFLNSVMDCKENLKFLCFGREDDTIATQLKSKLEEISPHLQQVSDESWSHFHYLYYLVTNSLHETHGERADLLTQQKDALEAHLKAVFSKGENLSQSILFKNKLALITMLNSHWLECTNEKEYNVRNNLAVQLHGGDLYHEELVAVIGTLSQHEIYGDYTLASRPGELDESPLDMTQYSRPSARLRGLKERIVLNDAKSSDILKFHGIDKDTFLNSMQSLLAKMESAEDKESIAFDDPTGVDAKVFAVYIAAGNDVVDPSFSGILSAIHEYDDTCKDLPTYATVATVPLRSADVPPKAPVIPLKLNVSLDEVSNVIPQGSSLDQIRSSILALAPLSLEQKKSDITNFKPPLNDLSDDILALTGQNFCDGVIEALKAKHGEVAQAREQQQQAQLQLQQQQQLLQLQQQQLAPPPPPPLQSSPLLAEKPSPMDLLRAQIQINRKVTEQKRAFEAATAKGVIASSANVPNLAQILDAMGSHIDSFCRNPDGSTPADFVAAFEGVPEKNKQTLVAMVKAYKGQFSSPGKKGFDEFSREFLSPASDVPNVSSAFHSVGVQGEAKSFSDWLKDDTTRAFSDLSLMDSKIIPALDAAIKGFRDQKSAVVLAQAQMAGGDISKVTMRKSKEITVTPDILLTTLQENSLKPSIRYAALLRAALTKYLGDCKI